MAATVLTDTNEWVSALMNPYSYPARLKAGWLDGRFATIVSVEWLDELARVLSRPRIRDNYGVTAEDTTSFPDLFADTATRVTITRQLRACRDRGDDLILQTAVEGQTQ